MSNQRHLSPFVPMAGERSMWPPNQKWLHKSCLFGAQGKCREKTKHFEYKHMGDRFSKPFKRGTKNFRRQPISPIWFVRWPGPLKDFGPGGRGRGGSGPALGHSPWVGGSGCGKLAKPAHQMALVYPNPGSLGIKD